MTLALVTAVLLSGCAGLRLGGSAGDDDPIVERKASQALAELRSLPGVLDGFVTSGPTGLPSQIELSTGLTLEPGYGGDLPALLEYTLAQAWSVTVREPTTKVSVGFLSDDSSVDLAPAAAELGWVGLDGPTIDLSVDEMAERYGPWPGPVPEKPAALG